MAERSTRLRESLAEGLGWQIRYELLREDLTALRVPEVDVVVAKFEALPPIPFPTGTAVNIWDCSIAELPDGWDADAAEGRKRGFRKQAHVLNMCAEQLRYAIDRDAEGAD